MTIRIKSKSNNGLQAFYLRILFKKNPRLWEDFVLQNELKKKAYALIFQRIDSYKAPALCPGQVIFNLAVQR